MIKREAKFTVLFRHYVQSHPKYTFQSCAFELKQTTSDSIPFSDVKEHQIDALLAVKHGEKGLLYKAPDDSRAIKPFDLFYLFRGDAYIVIRYPKFFCIIDIDEFCREQKRNKRKSLTADRAKDISIETIAC